MDVSKPAPIANIRVDRYELASAATSFCIITLDLTGEETDFNLKMFNSEDSSSLDGVLFTPCGDFCTSVGLEAEGLFNEKNQKTNWRLRSTTQKFKGLEINFRYDGSIEQAKIGTSFQFAAIMHNFRKWGWEWRVDGNPWNKIDEEEVLNPNQAQEVLRDQRFNWISKRVDNAEAEVQLFHPKQKATIQGIDKVKDSLMKKDPGELHVTYVGLDDAANYVSSMRQIKSNTKESENKIKEIEVRADSDDDSTHNTDWFKKVSEEYGDDVKTPNHQDNWETTDIIIDTYTVNSWPDKKDDDAVIKYIMERVQCLKKGGSLILTYPSNKDGAFDINSKPPAFFSKSNWKEQLKNRGIEVISDSVFSGCVWTIIRKAEFDEPGVEATWVGTGKTETSTRDSLEGRAPPEIHNWREFVEEIRKLGNKEHSITRPVELNHEVQIKDHIEEALAHEPNYNIVIIQAHPGWGKSAIVGSCLFPRDRDSPPPGYEVYMGELNQIHNYCKKADKKELNKQIMIIDDLHKYDKDGSGNKISMGDVLKKSREIADSVALLILTVRIKEWGGIIGSLNQENIRNRAECFDKLHDLEEEELLTFVPKLAQKNGFKALWNDEGIPNTNHKMWDAFQKWAKHATEMLFNDENLRAYGGNFNPRKAIYFLRECREQFKHDSNFDLEALVNDYKMTDLESLDDILRGG
ncbi:MAG: hypothetical protein QGI21_06835 [Candidatus Poseidoniaceae archaeon]|jgi:hypothetical protein|nr:hypothetical protein [Candidatus Poseidoniaceae archaeon]